MSTTKTQTGKARIRQTVDRLQTGRARISATTTQTQFGRANIVAPATSRTQTGKARIKGTPLQTQTGRAKIHILHNQTQTGKATIYTVGTKTQTGKARIVATTPQTQSGLARIKLSTAQAQLGKAHIGAANTAVLAPATYRLAVSYGGFAIDETNGCLITSKYDCDDTQDDGTFHVEFSVRLVNPTGVTATDDASFASLLRAVESDITGLRTPRQRLLATLSGATVKDWNFTALTQTAFMIRPELTLLEHNSRVARYRFVVRCQFPGNIPGNVRRRDSLTQIGVSLRQRRVCAIQATWTSSPRLTAYAQYLAAGDAFFTAFLPTNGQDQYSTTGVWVRADEDPAFNDENSIITVTRTYWEVFAGRRDSTVQTISTIGNRRVCQISGTFVATTGYTALQNYTNNAGAYYNRVLPTPETQGSWVLVDEEPSYNDQNGVLTVLRTYHEVVNGLREFYAQVTEDAAGLRTLVLSGTYLQTGNSARTNYTSNINTLVASALAAESITRYESHSVPAVTGYGTTGKEYFFTHTYRELAYPQSGEGWDDHNVRFETIEVSCSRPFDPMAFTDSITPTRLQTCTAQFVAVIDKDSAGGDDPTQLWDDKLRLHVINAITSKLGSGVTAVQVVSENVGVGLHANQLVGSLALVVTGGSVLWLRLTQTITQVPGRDFAPRGDGTAFSYYPYRLPPEKLLRREGACEYVIGADVPELFAVDDENVSGFGFEATGMTAQESIDAQNAETAYELPEGNWVIDRRASPPYAYSDTPTTRGDGDEPFQTVVHMVTENWRYITAVEPGVDITGDLSA